MGIGPPRGTNFLLNEGTLKFGAGGEAQRAIACGSGSFGFSVKSAIGGGCVAGEVKKDCRLPWLEGGGLRAKIRSSSSGRGSSDLYTPSLVGGEFGTLEEVNEEERTSDAIEPLVGFVASVRPVETDPDRDSMTERRLTDVYELRRDCQVAPPTDCPSSSMGDWRFCGCRNKLEMRCGSFFTI